MGYRDIDAVMRLMGGMDSATPPVAPIIVRHSTMSISDLDPMFGFMGFVTSSSKSVLGAVNVTSRLDSNKPLRFYADANGVQWGVMPDCPQNRKMLITFARTLPLTLVEGPKELLDEYRAVRASTPDPTEKQSKGRKLTDRDRDPFFGVKLTDTMNTEGETSNDSGKTPVVVEEE
jgi:hypothetical protein